MPPNISQSSRIVGVMKEIYVLKPSFSTSSSEREVGSAMPLTSLAAQIATRKKRPHSAISSSGVSGSSGSASEDIILGCLIDIDEEFYTTQSSQERLRIRQGRVIKIFYKTTTVALQVSQNIKSIKVRCTDETHKDIEVLLPWPHPNLHVHRFGSHNLCR